MKLVNCKDDHFVSERIHGVQACCFEIFTKSVMIAIVGGKPGILLNLTNVKDSCSARSNRVSWVVGVTVSHQEINYIVNRIHCSTQRTIIDEDSVS